MSRTLDYAVGRRHSLQLSLLLDGSNTTDREPPRQGWNCCPCVIIFGRCRAVFKVNTNSACIKTVFDFNFWFQREINQQLPNVCIGPACTAMEPYVKHGLDLFQTDSSITRNPPIWKTSICSVLLPSCETNCFLAYSKLASGCYPSTIQSPWFSMSLCGQVNSWTIELEGGGKKGASGSLVNAFVSATLHQHCLV